VLTVHVSGIPERGASAKSRERPEYDLFPQAKASRARPATALEGAFGGSFRPCDARNVYHFFIAGNVWLTQLATVGTVVGNTSVDAAANQPTRYANGEYC
jgi:hypothetical protein